MVIITAPTVIKEEAVVAARSVGLLLYILDVGLDR